MRRFCPKFDLLDKEDGSNGKNVLPNDCLIGCLIEFDLSFYLGKFMVMATS